MKKRIISLFLALVLVLGMLPIAAAEETCSHESIEERAVSNGNRTHTVSKVCKDCGETVTGQTVTVDFMAFARNAAQQDWWQGLRDSKVSGIKVIGTGYNTAPMTAAEKEALAAMKDYLAANENWMLEEGSTTYGYTHDGIGGLTKGGRRVFINTDSANGDYGLRFATDRLGTVSDDRDKLVLTVDVPQEGPYTLSMDLFNEIATSPEVDGTSSLCYGNILVNGKTVYTDYLFKSSTAAAEQKEVSFGVVELAEGENTIAIQITKDVNKATNAVTGTTNRYSVNLRSMTLAPTGGTTVGCTDENGDENCDICSGLAVCRHPETTCEATPNGDGQTHYAVKTCIDCGEVAFAGNEACADTVSKTVCNNNGTHTIIHNCGICGGIVSEETVECADTDGDELCDTCYFDMAAADDSGAVKVDFIKFAKQASKQSWWDDLRDTNTAGIKVIGSAYTGGVAMNATEKAAYQAMLQYLDENQNWSLKNGTTIYGYETQYGGRRVFINTDTKNGEYGLRFDADRVGSKTNGDDRDKLIITVDAPEAGVYSFVLDVLNEHLYGSAAKVAEADGKNSTEGCGKYNIYVNGKLLYRDYYFRNYTRDTREIIRLGAVELVEGENTVILQITNDAINAAGASNRRAVNLCSMTFEPLGGVAVQEYLSTQVNLIGLYLPAGGSAEGYSVATSNDLIATASINAAGVVTINGVTQGEAEIYVLYGAEVAYTIPVTVETFEGTIDELKGSPAKLDFMAFADRAVEQSWWQGLAGEGDVKQVTASDTALTDWLDTNSRWNIERFGDGLTLNGGSAKYALGAKGMVEFTIDIPAEGLYNLNAEYLQTADGGIMDLAVNGTDIYSGLSTDGQTKVVKASLGAVQLKKGINTVSVDAEAAVYLRAITFTPLGAWQAEVGSRQYVDLNDTYLPFDVQVTSAYTAKVENTAIADASFDEEGLLVFTGKAVGRTAVTVTNGSETICTAYVDVVQAGTLQSLSFTLDDFKSETLELGEIAVGDLTGTTTQGTAICEKQLRLDGKVYFATSDSSVAKVDQTTGNVTCVAEGTAVITAYAMVDGVTLSDSATLVVTDDTDLASIDVTTEVGYLGVGNSVTMNVSGLKSSGAAANMGMYPITWSVDDESLAMISENGRLTALKTGTVTVTATAAVMRMPVTDTYVLQIVENSELAGQDIILDYTYGRIAAMQTAAVESHGHAINWEKTDNADTITYLSAQGFELLANAGEKLAIDFEVKKSGWYQLEVRGKSFPGAGALCDVLVGDTYVGPVNFGYSVNSNYDGGGHIGTIYLEAGVHTIELISTQNARRIYLGRVYFHATEDPREVSVALQAEKTELVAGETTTVTPVMTDANNMAFYLAARSEVPEFDNYYILSSSDPQVAEISGSTLTAKAAGKTTITMTGSILGESFTRELTVTVQESSFVRAELTAETTTVKPDSEPVQLTLTTYGLGDTAQTAIPDGVEVAYESGNTSVATVDENGLVTIVGEGSALITATLTEGERTVEATLWITVTQGKTAPTVYTEEERAIAQENVLKYDWAWAEKESVVKKADIYVENLDLIYNMWLHEGFPRSIWVGYEGDDNYRFCRYCGVDIVALHGSYPWKVDPINNPWKVTCPECDRDFPSNDFGAYYESGLGEDGRFYEELADKSLLTNDLYPEMGEGWGVDNGWGYDSGTGYHTYIPYYISCVLFGLNGMDGSTRDILGTLADAYLYTGDEKYGSAGAILMDRIADIYPDYYLGRKLEDGSIAYPISKWYTNDGNSGRGKIIGVQWDGMLTIVWARAADAFWPAMDNPDVIEYLQGKASLKGLTPEDITPEYIRSNVEENVLLEIYKAATQNHMEGNFGMEEAAVLYAAVALDRLPESEEMINWVFTKNEAGGTYLDGYATGGDVMRTLIEDVDRDGFGDEVSFSYNALFVGHCMDMADALAGYTRVEGVDLWKNQKFRELFVAHSRTVLCGHLTPQMGETSGPFQTIPATTNVEYMTTAFVNTGMQDVELAQALYAANGNTTDGLRGDIFTKDPESGVRSVIEQIIAEHGEWDMSESNMLCGFGMAILREGPAKYVKGVNDAQFSDYWMYFGFTDEGHGQLNALTFDVEAFGLTLSGNMNYPLIVAESDFERMQWIANTVSKNTVVVNDYGQEQNIQAGFPKHFEDAGYAKIMDVDAPNAYAETDIYRRTMVTVNNGDGVYYAVDFFRVLGGSEHVYSLHGATRIEPATEGLTMTAQPIGTYAGPDVPFGAHTETDVREGAAYQGSGYSWLWDVSRDDDPETTFCVDWQIEDFQHSLTTSAGIHMKFTMLSEEPMTEVALADGRPPEKAYNPDHVEYMLVRRSGTDGMDTLFTSVIEPYQNDSYIASSELVDVVLIEGVEDVHDKAAAIKVTLKSGRVDYIVYATNPDCIYEIDGTFTFQGFAGVVSYTDGRLTYAWGSEAVKVADVIENAQARVTGTVTDFTKGITMDGYSITITMDQPVSEEELTDRYIYVDTDGTENGVYRIYGAEVTGNTAVLDLKTQTLVRKYVDGFNIDLGYIHNIAEGQTYTIPLSCSFNMGDLFTYTADTLVRAGNNLSLTTGVSGAGVTYEAEGMPSGMKFVASNGQLTWKPSKAQVGRYPITVKAVQDGEVVGEMSFVIYVVSYTGSTYSADVCTHSKAVTYTVDNVVETVCSACGTITKKPVETVQKFDIAGTNMTLGSELKLNVLVRSDDLGEGTYTAKIRSNGVESEQTFTKYNSTYHYVTVSVAAKQMADAITVEVMDGNGNVVSEVYETSVRAYAMKVLSNSAMTAKVRTLVVDMLNYGAQAQSYFSYNTEDLANSLLTQEQKALATASVTCTNKQVKGTNFYGTNLSLEDRIVLNLYFRNCTADMYAEVNYIDYTGNVQTVTKSLTQYTGSIYAVVVDDVVLADAFSAVTVTVYNADDTVHGTVTDSVESYCARAGQSGLNDAIMKFAYSAKQYLS